jgi:hypothetical protein
MAFTQRVAKRYRAASMAQLRLGVRGGHLEHLFDRDSSIGRCWSCGFVCVTRRRAREELVTAGGEASSRKVD